MWNPFRRRNKKPALPILCRCGHTYEEHQAFGGCRGSVGAQGDYVCMCMAWEPSR